MKELRLGILKLNFFLERNPIRSLFPTQNILFGVTPLCQKRANAFKLDPNFFRVKSKYFILIKFEFFKANQ